MNSLSDMLNAYDADAPLERACTIPSAWYTDGRVLELERRGVFGGTWQMVARLDQLGNVGAYVTADVAGEPVVITRGRDDKLRAFFNVCRHHAAAVMTEPEGTAKALTCPYHGWTYSLDGRLKGAGEFDGVCDFEKGENGLVSVALDTWEGFVFVRLVDEGPTLAEFLGDLAPRVSKLRLGDLRFAERRTYEVGCNWKVFVDNYLDGGYHVPHAHKSLNSVIDFGRYTIENKDRFCEQTAPLDSADGDPTTAAVRRGDRAYYYWQYPNFMLNWYEGVMDTNLVLPMGIDRTRVIFDFYFGATHEDAAAANLQSMDVADVVQDEDVAVCESVQRGLGSRAYDTGRLSVRREAGEHLFHRLLAHDLRSALTTDGNAVRVGAARFS